MSRHKLVGITPHLTIGMILAITPVQAEIIISEPLNLRQTKLDSVADLATKSLEEHRSVVRVSTRKVLRGSREAYVVFEPENLTQNSFEAQRVQCLKRRRSWICRKPSTTRFYYEKFLSNSIAIGEGVTPTIAEELIKALRKSREVAIGAPEGRYLDFGGFLYIERDSEMEYSVYGSCNCVYVKTADGFRFKHYRLILE